MCPTYRARVQQFFYSQCLFDFKRTIYNHCESTGGHLVAGHNHDRVRPDRAAEPRDVADARPPQDPEERAAQARAAEPLEQGLQRLRRQGPDQGPDAAADRGGPAQASVHQSGPRLQAHPGSAARVQGRRGRGGARRRRSRGTVCFAHGAYCRVSPWCWELRVCFTD